MNTSVSSATGRRRRRKHSAEFKAQLVQACEQPGMSSAAIAMANGINANLLRRWVNDAERCESTVIAPAPSPPPTPEFIPLQLPAPKPQADIRIELQRSGVSVSVIWPVSAAVECASWMREILK